MLWLIPAACFFPSCLRRHKAVAGRSKKFYDIEFFLLFYGVLPYLVGKEKKNFLRITMGGDVCVNG